MNCVFFIFLNLPLNTMQLRILTDNSIDTIVIPQVQR